MDSYQQATPIKMEHSPAESFVSAAHCDGLPSLFGHPSPSSPTINPLAMLSPSSYQDEKPSPSDLSVIAEDDASSATPSPEKKPTKKRKSWGQVLPEPKTNLPPRKRAKTEDEKEQRRVERVLRNRRAAQSSRERKRQEVEALEQRTKELESIVVKKDKAILLLAEELKRYRTSSSTVTGTPSVDVKDSHLTLSSGLFGSSNSQDLDTVKLLDDLLRPTTQETVNPASLSPPPELENTEEPPEPDTSGPKSSTPEDQAKSGKPTQNSPPDVSQRPAAMLSSEDLQCPSVENPQSLPMSQTWTSALLAFNLQVRMMLLSASAILSACQRPLIQIVGSSKAGFSLPPSPPILTTIIWLVTLPRGSFINPLLDSISTSSSQTTQTMPHQTLWQRATNPLRTTTASSRKFTTLRIKSLQAILSSSPNLARPLMDATMEALRLVSEGREDQFLDLSNGLGTTRGNDSELHRCLNGIVLPSKEVLLTLLWTLKVEMKKMEKQQHQHSDQSDFKLETVAPFDKYYIKSEGDEVDSAIRGRC